MKAETKEENTAYINLSDIALKIILSYLYQVKQPLSTLRITNENSTLIFDEIASVNYYAPLLDLWVFISKHLPEDQTFTDELLYIEKAELHKLPFTLLKTPKVRVLSLMKKSTIIYTLKQRINLDIDDTYPDTYLVSIKFLWASTWCVLNAKKVSKEDRFDVLNVITTLAQKYPVDLRLISDIAGNALRLGKCDVLITYAGYLACGISPLEMIEDPKLEERDLCMSLEASCTNCGRVGCKGIITSAINTRDVPVTPVGIPFGGGYVIPNSNYGRGAARATVRRPITPEPGEEEVEDASSITSPYN